MAPIEPATLHTKKSNSTGKKRPRKVATKPPRKRGRKTSANDDPVLEDEGGSIEGAHWKNEDTKILLDELVEAKSRGEATENGFKPQVWTRVSRKLKATGFPRASSHCKSFYRRLKADVNEFDSLKLISGMGWNEEKGTVTAIEEVWDTLLAAKPKLSRWKNKIFPYYSIVAPLFHNTAATGEFTLSTGSPAFISQRCDVSAAPDTSSRASLAASSPSPPRIHPEEGSPTPWDFDTAGNASQDTLLHEDEDEDEEEGDNGQMDDNGSRSDVDECKQQTVDRSQSVAQPSAFKRVVSSNVKRVHQVPGARRGGANAMYAVGDALRSVNESITAAIKGLDAGNVSTSPMHQRRAFKIFEDHEGADMADGDYNAAVKVFSNTKLADEYMRYSGRRLAARGMWLREEIARQQEEAERQKASRSV